MKSSLIYSILGIVLLFSSCQKVIDLKVNDAEERLVIEALYDANKEEVLVNVSRTINVFSKDGIPRVTDALVKIINETSNISIPLVNNGDGSYILNNYPPEFNSLYTVVVEVDGVEYFSSDTLVPVVPLDTIIGEYEPITPFGPGYATYLEFEDPEGPNFYRAISTVNDTLRDKVGDLFLFDDGFTSGNTQKIPMIFELFQEGDTLKVDLVSYSEKSFEYYLGLMGAAGGSTSSPAPANPPQDWSDENVLGHFTAFGYSSKTIIYGD